MAAVTKIQSVHRATQIRIIYHEIVAAVRGTAGVGGRTLSCVVQSDKLKKHFFGMSINAFVLDE